MMRDRLIDALLGAKMQYYVRHSHTKPPCWGIYNITNHELIRGNMVWKEAENICDRMNAAIKLDAILEVIGMGKGDESLR